MMKNLIYSIIAMVIFLLLISSAEAQNRQRAQQYDRKFDVNTVETVKGKILRLLLNKEKPGLAKANT